MHQSEHLPAIDPRASRSIFGPSSNGFLCAALAVALTTLVLTPVLFTPTSALAESAHGKRSSNRSWHGYGFLPGYEPPEVVEWRNMRARRPTFWYGGPGFYRGRWNGGGFGPCWTPTPIGPHWNCG